MEEEDWSCLHVTHLSVMWRKIMHASVTFVSEPRQNVSGQIVVFGDVLTVPFNKTGIWILSSSLDDSI